MCFLIKSIYLSIYRIEIKAFFNSNKIDPFSTIKNNKKDPQGWSISFLNYKNMAQLNWQSCFSTGASKQAKGFYTVKKYPDWGWFFSEFNHGPQFNTSMHISSNINKTSRTLWCFYVVLAVHVPDLISLLLTVIFY
jgi:hypothetical protein